MDVQKTFLRSDCALVGGDSGGPLFDITGLVIGIHSRIGARITDNIHVPVDLYRTDWDKIAKGETIGGGNPFANPNMPYLGIERDPDSDACKVARVQPDTPADKAGMKADDVIVKFDGQDVNNFNDLLNVMVRKKPGDEVEVVVKRGDDNVTLKVKLGKRPAE
jgi:serine protease Do